MAGPMIERTWLAGGTVSLVLLLASACDSDGESIPSTDGSSGTDELSTADETPAVDGSSTIALSCVEIAAAFVTRGSANADLPDPEVGAACVDGDVIITSNQIPDFPYIGTTPGIPRAFDLEYTITATPTLAETPTDIPALGPIGMAINGIPIYGPTEGAGGDVLAMPNFVECGGHNGPGGYHYHTFSVVGSDDCLFTEAEVSAEPRLFGYAFDGYPIYSGNARYTSSWFLSDPSLFATDTFSAHTYAEGSGDLDRCNGRTDENGDYAYYTTDEFPYVLGCYRGEIEIEARGRAGGAGPTDALTRER